MKPSSIKNIIIKRFKAGIKRPLMLESSPGLGKTMLARQAAEELGVGFKVVHVPLLQPEDYGFPVISADKSDVKFIVSKEYFPLVGSDCPEKGILLLDELSQGDNGPQKILAQLMHERVIHGQQLKPGWLIVATGNRQSDRAGANRILSHLGNRVTRTPLEASLDDWTNWALTNDIKTEVIAFIRFRPELLNKFEAQQDINPTPRAWADGVSKGLGVYDAEEEFSMFAGDVGEGAAAEFCAFLKIYRKLPSPDAILVNPKGTPVPTDPATLYALCGALAHKTSVDNFDRVMEYVNRVPQEFGVLYIRDALKRCPELRESRGFITWAAGEGKNLLM